MNPALGLITPGKSKALNIGLSYDSKLHSELARKKISVAIYSDENKDWAETDLKGLFKSEPQNVTKFEFRVDISTKTAELFEIAEEKETALSESAISELENGLESLIEQKRVQIPLPQETNEQLAIVSAAEVLPMEVKEPETQTVDPPIQAGAIESPNPVATTADVLSIPTQTHPIDPVSNPINASEPATIPTVTQSTPSAQSIQIDVPSPSKPQAQPVPTNNQPKPAASREPCLTRASPRPSLPSNLPQTPNPSSSRSNILPAAEVLQLKDRLVTYLQTSNDSLVEQIAQTTQPDKQSDKRGEEGQQLTRRAISALRQQQTDRKAQRTAALYVCVSFISLTVGFLAARIVTR